MKKNLFKVLGVAILGVVMLVGLGSCSKKEEKLPTQEEAKDLTVADVFQKVEWTNDVGVAKPNGELKSTTYNAISSANSIDSDKKSELYIKLTASYDFEITKISAKHQYLGSYTNINEQYGMYLTYNTESLKPSNCLKKNEMYYIATKDDKNNTDWNAVHNLEFTFSSKELIIHKGDFIIIFLFDNLAYGKNSGTKYTNIEIKGNIVIS